MSPIISYKGTSTEFNPAAPVTEDTIFTLKVIARGLFILQNDAAVAVLQMPIMKAVRALRKLYPQAKLDVK